MDKSDARIVAEIFGGKVEHTGGDVYVVVRGRRDGSVVVFHEEAIHVYRSRRAWETGAHEARSIELHRDYHDYSLEDVG